jgi:hypothetical protein
MSMDCDAHGNNSTVSDIWIGMAKRVTLRGLCVLFSTWDLLYPPLHQLASIKSPLLRRRTTHQDICTGSGLAGRGRAGAHHGSVPMYTEWAWTDTLPRWYADQMPQRACRGWPWSAIGAGEEVVRTRPWHLRRAMPWNWFLKTTSKRRDSVTLLLKSQRWMPPSCWRRAWVRAGRPASTPGMLGAVLGSDASLSALALTKKVQLKIHS